MPIPHRSSNDFFNAPINQFYIEENNEAAIIDENIEDYNTSVDVFSFGFILYTLITGGETIHRSINQGN